MKINSKVLLFLFIAVMITACAGQNNSDYPVAGFSLMCRGNGGTQQLEIVVFEGKLSMNGGAGFTTQARRVSADNGIIKYEEEDYGTYALWNQGRKWTYFRAINPYAPTQKLYTGDNAMQCEITRRYTRAELTTLVSTDPYFTGDWDD